MRRIVATILACVSPVFQAWFFLVDLVVLDSDVNIPIERTMMGPPAEMFRPEHIVITVTGVRSCHDR
jgi:hypothetical protein